MKKRFLLLTAIAGMGYLVFSSASAGPARAGYDCTGAESAGTGSFANPTGCMSGGGCHGSAATGTITVALELDSAGVATTHYRPGKTYTIKITGTNGTGTTTESDAGTWSSSVPASTHVQAPGTYTQLTVAEHSSAISVSGTSFTQSFTWTAPTSNVGSISFWGAANFVNGNTNADAGDKWNTNHIQIDIWPSTLSVADISSEFTVNAFPNPATTNLNLQLANAQPGTYTVQVFSMNGSLVAAQNMEVNSASQPTNINTSNWATGLYNVVIEKDGSRKSLMVVRQ